MHSDIETKRTKVQPTNVQCHHASLNDTLEVEIPEYGSINSIQLMMHLTGGVGEASFQPAGYSRPNSDCEGIPFTPPINDQSTISYIDNRRHLQKKEQWSTKVIRRAVVSTVGESDEESDVTTAEFSINDPPSCNREDGSAYYPQVAKKAQILQRMHRILVEVTVCQVDLRILVGWCGGDYVALNYMHKEDYSTTYQCAVPPFFAERYPGDWAT